MKPTKSRILCLSLSAAAMLVPASAMADPVRPASFTLKQSDLKTQRFGRSSVWGRSSWRRVAWERHTPAPRAVRGQEAPRPGREGGGGGGGRDNPGHHPTDPGTHPGGDHPQSPG